MAQEPIILSASHLRMADGTSYLTKKILVRFLKAYGAEASSRLTSWLGMAKYKQ
jgi:hypothetical protein